MAAKPLAVVFADSHLREKTWGARTVYGDSYYSFSQILDYAIDQGIPHIIGAGDLIDKRINDAPVITFVNSELRRLAEQGISFYFVQGQHEGSSTPWFSLGTNAVHMHGECLEINDVIIYGMDYQRGETFKEAISGMCKEAQVLVAHQTILEWMGERAMPQCSFADIPTVQLLISGDFHSTIYDTDKYHGKDGQRLAVYSPGSTYQCNIGESNQCSFGVLYDDLTISKIPLGTRKFDAFSVLREDELDEFLGNISTYLEGAAEYADSLYLPTELQTPLWRIIHSADLRDIEGRVKKIVGDRAHVFFKEIPREKPEGAKARSMTAEDKEALTLLRCLPQAIDPEKEPEAYSLCRQLLDATGADAPRVLAAWKKEMMEE